MCYGSFKGKGIEHCGGKSNEGSSHQWRGKDKTTGLAAAMGISGLDGNSRLNGNLVKLDAHDPCSWTFRGGASSP